MKFLASSICKIGGRDYNQDFVALSIENNTGCFVACDGLGSYVGSEVASRLCATKIIETYNQIKATDEYRAFKKEFCSAYVQTAHNYVTSYKEKNPRVKSSCTTVACVVSNADTTVISHIGDTRVYLFSDNKLKFQTLDHSLSQVAVEMGQISAKEIRTHKDQNKLTRVLGSNYFLPPDCYENTAPLKVGDSLVLCTDGFWEYVFEDEMLRDISSSFGAPSDAIAKMEARLLARVSKYNDNYSCICVMVVD